MTVDTPARDPVDDLVEYVAVAGRTEGSRHDLRPKSLAYRLRRVAHRLELEMRRELAAHGIDLWELEVLAALMRAPEGRMTAGELMTAIAVTSGTVTHRITRVQERGWVRRDPDPADRRSVVVSLTESGHRRALEVLDVKTEVEDDVLGVLDAHTLDVVNDALRTVGRRLDERTQR